MYLPVSMDVIVCLVTPTAKANSSWDSLCCFRKVGMFVFKVSPLLYSLLVIFSIACFAQFVKCTLQIKKFNYPNSCVIILVIIGVDKVAAIFY